MKYLCRIMEDIIRLHVIVLKKSDNSPLTGEQYNVKFYDKDIIKDDYLGESSLDSFGHAIIPVTKSRYRSADSPFEKKPDIYFTVLKDGKIIYKSPICKNIDMNDANDFPATGGFHYNLGTFVI